MVANLGESKQGKIVRLGSAAGENDLCRTAPQQLRHSLPRTFHREACVLSMVMNRGSVPELLAEVRTHRVQDLREHRRGCIIVEIDSPHHPRSIVLG